MVPNTALQSVLHCISDKSFIWIIVSQLHSTNLKHDYQKVKGLNLAIIFVTLYDRHIIYSMCLQLVFLQ